MYWILLTSCLCSLSLLTVGKALPIRRSERASLKHHKYHDELGDISLFPKQEELLEELRHGNTKRAVLKESIVKPWAGGKIPYKMDLKTIGTKYERSFNKAIAIWEKYTCVDFVEQTNEREYVILTNSTLCNSHIGKPMPGDLPHYKVSLGPQCGASGNAMHELGHVLGFFHEHQRGDRDQYITINPDALEDTTVARENYRNYGDYIDSLGVEYDYASIMHYSQKAFAKKGRHAFKINKDKELPKCLPEAGDVGQRKSISIKDIEQVNKLYKCPAKKVLEDLDDCKLFNFNPSSPRKKTIKTTNKISLGVGVDTDEANWMTCRTGGCHMHECDANFDKNRRKRNSFTTLNMKDDCMDHEFTLRTTIHRAKSDKVKVGDNITLEWKPRKFLDCSSMTGKCSMTECNMLDSEGSNEPEDCPNHIFRIDSEVKDVGDIVKTYDEIQLVYVQNGHLLHCTDKKCTVQAYNGCNIHGRVDDDEMVTDQVNCKPPSFIIQK